MMVFFPMLSKWIECSLEIFKWCQVNGFITRNSIEEKGKLENDNRSDPK